MIRLLAVCLLFVGSALTHMPVMAATSTSEDLSAFKELQQIKWETQKELQQKDTEALRQQIAAVDKRVDDQLTQVGQGVDRFGVLISLLGLGITALLVLGGFLGYRNAKAEATADAKEAATSEARASAEEWFKTKAVALTQQITELEGKAAHVHKQMDTHARDVQTDAEKYRSAINQLQKSIEDPNLKSSPEQEDARRTLAERDKELKDTNEDNYSFDDWNARAHAAHSAANLEEAAYFWLKAAGILDAGATNVAQALLNRGITQSELKQHESAIATYDEVLRRFGEATEPAIRELVAGAMLNKGVIHSEHKRYEAAITTYDEVIRRLKDISEPALRELLAMVYVNKGNTQIEMKLYEAAISSYDELPLRFNAASEPAFRGRVTTALNGAGFARLMLAKAFGPSTVAGKDALQMALKNLNDAIALSEDLIGFALGNRSYVQCLLGQLELAATDFAMALRASVNGGQFLYEATLKDLEISPVSEDGAMRALVERAWLDFNSKDDNTGKTL